MRAKQILSRFASSTFAFGSGARSVPIDIVWRWLPKALCYNDERFPVKVEYEGAECIAEVTVVRSHPNGVPCGVIENGFMPNGPAIRTAVLNPLDQFSTESCSEIERKKECTRNTSRPTSSSSGLRERIQIGNIRLDVRGRELLRRNGEYASHDIGASHPALNDLGVRETSRTWWTKDVIGFRHSREAC